MLIKDTQISKLEDLDKLRSAPTLNKEQSENIFNQAIGGNYEMGSVIKPITVAMGVDKGIINPDMVFDVSKPISGIKDFKPHNGKYNVKEIIVNSSNIGTAALEPVSFFPSGLGTS